MRIVHLSLAIGVVALAGCQPAPQPPVFAQNQGEPLQCAASEFTAAYTRASSQGPASVDVFFRRTKPTSSSAEAALRKCLEEVVDHKGPTSEVTGTVWLGDHE